MFTLMAAALAAGDTPINSSEAASVAGRAIAFAPACHLGELKAPGRMAMNPARRAFCPAQRSQGGVKVPTGGDGALVAHEPASALPAMPAGVGRPGVIPGPTVTVRMKESAICGGLPGRGVNFWRCAGWLPAFVRPDSGNCSPWTSHASAPRF